MLFRSGHPLLESIQDLNKSEALQLKNDKPVIALLPGSRVQEIKNVLPVMIDSAKNFANDYQVVIAGAPSVGDEIYQSFLSNEIQLVRNQTYSLLSKSIAALVTSGTATLETALFNVPQVVCYKGSPISYHIAKQLVKIKYISLVNLILDRPAVTELIQNDLNVERLKLEIAQLQKGQMKRESILRDYEELRILLGQEAVSEKIAQSLLKTIDAARS